MQLPAKARRSASVAVVLRVDGLTRSMLGGTSSDSPGSANSLRFDVHQLSPESTLGPAGFPWVAELVHSSILKLGADSALAARPP